MMPPYLRKKLTAFVLLGFAPIFTFYGLQFGDMASDLLVQYAFGYPAEHYVWQAYPLNHLWYLAALVLSAIGITAWMIGLLIEVVTHTRQFAE